MDIVNPGCVLPFYAKTTWQRHRQIGTDVLPFGLVAPNARLMPFQLYFATGDVPEAVGFSVVSAVDDTTVVVFDSSLLTVEAKSGGGFWVTWYASENLNTIPDCGFWYVKVVVDEVEYFSEVLHLKPDNNFDALFVVIDDCDAEEFVLSLTVRADDQLSAPPVSETIEYFDSSMWNTVGDNEGTIFFNDYPPNELQIRRIVTTASGVTITQNFLVTWSNELDPCADIAIESVSPTITSGGSTTERWRMRLTNDFDKGTVLYQNGFQQWFYFTPIFDAPQIERDTDITENGFGDEITRYSKTTERWRFEASDIPDYLCHIFAMLGDVDTVLIENVATSDSFFVTDLRFAFRRQSPSLNIGEFNYRRRNEVDSGCQTNFALA